MILTILARKTWISMILGLKRTFRALFWVGDHNFTENFENGQSELRADFARIGKLRPRSFQRMSPQHVIRNIASRNRKKRAHPRKHPIGSRFP